MQSVQPKQNMIINRTVTLHCETLVRSTRLNSNSRQRVKLVILRIFIFLFFSLNVPLLFLTLIRCLGIRIDLESLLYHTRLFLYVSPDTELLFSVLLTSHTYKCPQLPQLLASNTFGLRMVLGLLIDCRWAANTYPSSRVYLNSQYEMLLMDLKLNYNSTHRST